MAPQADTGVNTEDAGGLRKRRSFGTPVTSLPNGPPSPAGRSSFVPPRRDVARDRDRWRFHPRTIATDAIVSAAAVEVGAKIVASIGTRPRRMIRQVVVAAWHALVRGGRQRPRKKTRGSSGRLTPSVPGTAPLVQQSPRTFGSCGVSLDRGTAGFGCRIRLVESSPAEKAEGEGFEPSIRQTTDNGFRDRRIRPLCHPSKAPSAAAQRSGMDSDECPRSRGAGRP